VKLKEDLKNGKNAEVRVRYKKLCMCDLRVFFTFYGENYVLKSLDKIKLQSPKEK
jgi:hypothetical protein